MWELRKIEEITKKALVEERGVVQGEEKFAAYTMARKNLVEQVLPEIKAVQPQLTDHGPDHVANVLDNAEGLLGEDIHKFRGIELYCLILSILFHDAGNVFDRKEHQLNIAKIYDYIRPGPEPNKQEKYIVLKATEAHCCEAGDGSKDALRDLDDTTQLDRKPVSLRQIAAILRFADELAEGPQRTSIFMQRQHKYSSDSQIFHKYAKITNVSIDRGNERIALTYNIDVDIDEHSSLSNEKEEELRELLDFTYKRIIKLNQERQYTKHYCDFLSPFKKTTVAFNFWIDGQHNDLGLVQVSLTDLVVPGDTHKGFYEYDRSYELKNIVEKIRECLKMSF